MTTSDALPSDRAADLRAMTASIDPAFLEILRMQLEGIADRMQDALVRSAISSIAREGMDCAAAIFLPDGRVIAQARSLPLLLGSMIPAVVGILKAFPIDDMRDGDALLMNDPWSGGTHLPDMVMVRPVMLDGALVALTAATLHHQDIGGSTPGSLPPDATDVFVEGLRLPPVRWRRNGHIDPGLRTVLSANSRTPDNLLGDLEAQWAAISLGERQVQELARAQGAAFAPGCDALILQAERMTRDALAALLDGVFAHADRLDARGNTPGTLPAHAAGSAPGDASSNALGHPLGVTVHVTLTKTGDRLHIDFTGSSAQAAAPINAPPAAVLAAVFFFMRTLAPDAPSNQGCLLAADWLLPDGSIVNPRFPAAVNARTATVKLACNTLLAAWAKADPVHASAPHSGVAVVMAVGGKDAAGRPYFFTEIIAGGAGAGPAGPGASGISTDVGNGKNLPVEMLESQAPLRLETYRRRRGSGGAGRHAGGDGVVRSYLLLEGEATVSYRGERHDAGAPGAQGGAAGAPSRAQVVRRDGSIEPLASKTRFIWRAGDRLTIETAGGGGWGAP
ncbi:5-oxoprolinase [Pigmentiphaga litoralis]|uniref:hydantoinase B/oxoprolinase family protein n=1 Tax=Pigmentiphaga litoralis TaxID=516702 RepID=UPI0019B1E7FF|nr:hydantoinase B/oxoprolinase family protein [Pigmentiphaga litoralis]GGX10879.1 5-oxoprolinase [Pigmentiphaga litoralis]